MRCSRPPQKIVFQSRPPGANNEIFVVSSSGAARTRPTRDRAVDASPTRSPDRKRIAFESNRHGIAASTTPTCT